MNEEALLSVLTDEQCEKYFTKKKQLNDEQEKAWEDHCVEARKKDRKIGRFLYFGGLVTGLICLFIVVVAGHFDVGDEFGKVMMYLWGVPAFFFLVGYCISNDVQF